MVPFRDGRKAHGGNVWGKAKAVKLADVVFPWPWKIVKSGTFNQPIYSVADSNGKEVASYGGPDGNAKANVILELGAEHAMIKRMHESGQ